MIEISIARFTFKPT